MRNPEIVDRRVVMSRGHRITASPLSDPPTPFAAEETRGRRDRGDQPPRAVFDPLDQYDQCYREPLRRALETQKPQIVENGELGGVPFVARAHPLTFDCDKHRRACRSLSMQVEAENLLHKSICRPWDCDRRGRDLWHSHSPDRCETPPWANLERELQDLYDDTDRGTWCVWVCDGPNRRYLGACVFFEFGRSSLRGRPSLKSDFYELAVRYAEAARTPGSKLEEGFFIALARHLSFPALGITFDAHTLRQREHESRQARRRGSLLSPHASQ